MLLSASSRETFYICCLHQESREFLKFWLWINFRERIFFSENVRIYDAVLYAVGHPTKKMLLINVTGLW
jgi:hypothetical protein